jgi:Tfp pilus assembly protein PilE
MIAVAIIALLAALIVPSFRKVRMKAQLTSCASNCKNLGTILETYSVDYDGKYPDLGGLAGLQQLIDHGNLGRLPNCPAAGQCTFTDYQSTANPNGYSFTCVGLFHTELTGAAGFPQYVAGLGLTERP